MPIDVEPGEDGLALACSQVVPLFHFLLEDLLTIRLFRALVEGILELSVRDNPGRIQEHNWRRLHFLVVSLVLHQALSERVHRVEPGGCSEK
jgi:hypothetical protein